MSGIVLTNVTKIYHSDVVGVQSMNVHVLPGELLVMLGPSGSGKTTTLRLIAGLEKPTEGNIRIGQTVVNDIPPPERDVAMVFQHHALYPHMTVYGNIAFPLKTRSLPKKHIDLRVRETARMLKIEELLARKPADLSGGQHQRAAIGRAIVREPKAFLFDEPLSNLDPKLRSEMRTEIKQLLRRLQATSIYVTHDQEEAMMMGDRIAVIKDGLVQQCDEPLEVYKNPVNTFVAAFVGTPTMNFFRGTLVRETGAVLFDAGRFRVRLAPDQSRRFADWIEQPLVLGIRPEGMGLRAKGESSPSNNIIHARVNTVEPYGENMDVHAHVGGDVHLVARIDATTSVRANETLQFHVDVDRAHLFTDDQRGTNLRYQA